MQSQRVTTIPNDAHITSIGYYPETSAICSIGKAPFHASVEITYQPGDVLLEFESFERWLHGLGTTNTTIEGLTRLIFDALVGVLGDIPLEVRVHASTTVHAPVTAIIRSGRENSCGYEECSESSVDHGCCSGGAVHRGSVHCGCSSD